MKRLLCALSVVMAFAGPAVAQHVQHDQSELPGTWKFEVFKEGEHTPVWSTYGVITKVNGRLITKDPVTGQSAPVALTADGVRLPLLKSQDDRVPITGGPLDAQFRFVPDAVSESWLNGGWIGLAQSPRAVFGSYKVRAIKLSALWACAHMNPTHTATTREEMQQLTQEHKCEGWHQIAGN